MLKKLNKKDYLNSLTYKLIILLNILKRNLEVMIFN